MVPGRRAVAGWIRHTGEGNRQPTPDGRCAGDSVRGPADNRVTITVRRGRPSGPPRCVRPRPWSPVRVVGLSRRGVAMAAAAGHLISMQGEHIWRSGQASRTRWARRSTAPAPTSAMFSEVAEHVELCLIGERGGETRIAMPEVDAYVWHCYLPTRAARPALRLPGARPVRAPARVPVQPEQAAARPVRQGGRPARSTGIPALFSYRSRRPGLAATTRTPGRT